MISSHSFDATYRESKIPICVSSCVLSYFEWPWLKRDENMLGRLLLPLLLLSPWPPCPCAPSFAGDEPCPTLAPPRTEVGLTCAARSSSYLCERGAPTQMVH